MNPIIQQALIAYEENSSLAIEGKATFKPLHYFVEKAQKDCATK